MNSIKAFTAAAIFTFVVAGGLGWAINGVLIAALYDALAPALGFGLAMAFITRVMERHVTPGATIDVVANLWRGWEAVGGKLVVKDGVLRFMPHSLNIQTAVLEIPLEQIASVEYANTLFVIPNGLRLVTRQGATYRFVVWGRARLVATLRAQL